MNTEGQWRPEGRGGRWHDISEEPGLRTGAAPGMGYAQQVRHSHCAFPYMRVHLRGRECVLCFPEKSESGSFGRLALAKFLLV